MFLTRRYRLCLYYIHLYIFVSFTRCLRFHTLPSTSFNSNKFEQSSRSSSSSNNSGDNTHIELHTNVHMHTHTESLASKYAIIYSSYTQFVYTDICRILALPQFLALHCVSPIHAKQYRDRERARAMTLVYKACMNEFQLEWKKKKK